MRITRIHHLTVAVRDSRRAARTFASLFGSETLREIPLPAFGVDVHELMLGDIPLQLASPQSRETPVMRFLERRGEGFYNLALEVDDLDAAVAELRAGGVHVSDPVEALPGVRSSFLAMGETHGLSIQLVELAGPAAPDEEPAAEWPSRPVQASFRPPAAARAASEPGFEFTPPVSPAPSDMEEPPAMDAGPDEGSRTPLDLTPDEWSDTD